MIGAVLVVPVGSGPYMTIARVVVSHETELECLKLEVRVEVDGLEGVKVPEHRCCSVAASAVAEHRYLLETAAEIAGCWGTDDFVALVRAHHCMVVAS